MNLVRRTMIESGVCSLCSQEEEDILCAIWSCPCLAGVWGYDDQWTFQEGENFVSFSNLVSFIVESNLNFELFATVSWSIWNRRNLVRISSLALPLDQVFHGALSFLQEYQNAQPCLTSSPPRPPTIWWLPLPNCCKINFDGVIFNDKEKAGIGVVIRNNQGLIMASLSHNVTLPSSAVEIEALAAAKALEFPLDLGVLTALLGWLKFSY